MNQSQSKKSKFALPLAVFGFLLIIATGTSMLIYEFQEGTSIPLFVAIIGLVLLIIAIMLRRKEMEKN